LDLAGSQTSDGIITAAKNAAVVDEESVSYAVKAADGFGIVNGDGFFAEIRAGHDESVEFSAGEKKMVERRIWKKHAEETVARCDAFRQTRVWLAREQNDGALDGEQKFPGYVVDFAIAFDLFDTAKHDGERLFDAAFAFAEGVDGRF
jgi:hypothetical protein